MRDNVEAESSEDYFRKSITVPFLYCTLNEMKTRFTDLHARTALELQLVPSVIEDCSIAVLTRFVFHNFIVEIRDINIFAIFFN